MRKNTIEILQNGIKNLETVELNIHEFKNLDSTVEMVGPGFKIDKSKVGQLFELERSGIFINQNFMNESRRLSETPSQ
jgi:hypothetical protein